MQRGPKLGCIQYVVTLTGILSAAETTMYAKCFKHVKQTFDFFFLILKTKTYPHF